MDGENQGADGVEPYFEVVTELLALSERARTSEARDSFRRLAELYGALHRFRHADPELLIPTPAVSQTTVSEESDPAAGGA